MSDLFLWRKSDGWKTDFELTDMPGLYEQDKPVGVSPEARVLLFDSKGRVVAEHRVLPPLHKRMCLNIDSLAAGVEDVVGTFCVFHTHTPAVVQQLGSHLAERGYVSYRYGDVPLRSYVHGNLDAVSLNHNGGLELLGGTSTREREYRLQHELLASSTYEIAVVNPSTKVQEIRCDVLRAKDGKRIRSYAAQLARGGSHVFQVEPCGATKRVVIYSRLFMARPLIFRFEKQRMDVLHG